MEKLLYIAFNDDKANNIQLDLLGTYPGVNAQCVLHNVSLPLRAIRKMHFKLTYKGIGIWLRNWKKELESYDYIVCIASQYSPQVLKWISRKSPKVKLINYYIDQIDISGYPVLDTNTFQNWTFNIQDSQKYKMKLNPQFWTRLNFLPKLKSEYDVSYVGADRGGLLKDRIELVNKLYRYCVKNDLNNYFYFVTTNQDIPSTIARTTYMSEANFYQILSKSKVIIELVEEDHQWITLRTFLALVNGKKLITNNKSIINERFYSPQNIFIIGVDKFKDLKKFIETPFITIPSNNLDYYEFKNWVGRIFNEY